MLKLRYGLMIVVCVVALAIAAMNLAAAQNDETVSCQGDFEATVAVGPNVGWALLGTLALDVTNGSATGTLMQDDGTTIPVVGQVNGRAINLAFDLGDDQYLFGSGTSWMEFSACDGMVGGTFAGPQVGDIGDWGYGIGG